VPPSPSEESAQLSQQAPTNAVVNVEFLSQTSSHLDLCTFPMDLRIGLRTLTPLGCCPHLPSNDLVLYIFSTMWSTLRQLHRVISKRQITQHTRRRRECLPVRYPDVGVIWPPMLTSPCAPPLRTTVHLLIMHSVRSSQNITHYESYAVLALAYSRITHDGIQKF
jgi:hypothetical protein